MQNKVIINRGDADIRVAFLEDNQLVEFHQEPFDQKSLVGNIYRGVIQDVIPGLQAAFVDIGLERNVFLHFLDVRAESLVMTEPNLEEALQRAAETVIPGRIVKKGRRDRVDLKAGVTEAPISKGDTIIVQVVKDGIGDKAPRVSTNLALAGRYVVLLPFPGQSGGVSRKVAMGKERFALKKILNKLRSKSQSFIMRTAGLGADEENIHTDVERLQDVWDEITTSFRSTKKPKLVYSDHNIVDRMVRDVFNAEIDEIILDDTTLASELRESLKVYMPELAKAVEVYEGTEPIFETFGVERQLDLAMENKFWLKSGGYLIIEETEALTAIDVNTGRFTGSKDQERTSFKINMEACEAIADQIRLRDIGGIIVIDFIDMLNTANKRKVTEEFHACMELDRAKSQIGQVGEFGLLMLTRKRKNKSLKKQIFEPCPYCDGKAHVLRKEEIWRRIKSDLLLMCEDADQLSAIVLTCEPAVAEFLESTYKTFIKKISHSKRLDVIIRQEPTLHREDFTLTGIERPGRDALLLPGQRLDARRSFKETLPYDSISTQEIVASITDWESDETPAEAPEQEEESNQKRTRRGRRGGRRRQQFEDDAPNAEATGFDPEQDEMEAELNELQEVTPLEEDEQPDSEPVAKPAENAGKRDFNGRNNNQHRDPKRDQDSKPKSSPWQDSRNERKDRPAATPSAAAPAPVAQEQVAGEFKLKSKLQIMSRNAPSLTKGTAPAADDKAKLPAAAAKPALTPNATISTLKSVKILTSFDKRLPVSASATAEVAEAPAPAPVAAAKIDPSVPFKPSRNLQVVARWGAKKETPSAPAAEKPTAPTKPAAAANAPEKAVSSPAETNEKPKATKRRAPAKKAASEPKSDAPEAAPVAEKKPAAAKKAPAKKAAPKKAASKPAAKSTAKAEPKPKAVAKPAEKDADSGAEKPAKKTTRSRTKKTAKTEE